MGKMVPFANNTKTTVHIGNKAIRPGDCREVDSDFIPGHVPDVADTPPAGNPLLDVLDMTVKQIRVALIALSDADLDLLEQAETDGKTRKGVLASIAEDRLRRASLTQDDDADAADPDMEAFVALLHAMSDEELAMELETCPETAAADRAAIEAEIAGRQSGEDDGQ